MISIFRRVEEFSLIYKTAQEVFYGVKNLPFNLNSEYSKFLKKVINAKTEKDYYLLICEFVNKLNDGHTDVNIPKTFLNKIGYLPFKLICINNNYFICDTICNLESCKFEKIKKINNIPFKNLVKKCFKYIHSINGFSYFNRLEKLMPLFLQKKNNVLMLENGQKFKFNLLSEKPEFNLPKLSSKNQFKKLEANNLELLEFENRIFYVKLDTFNNLQIITECCEKLKALKNPNYIILDIRNNEGGMTKNAEKLANLFIKGEYSACKKFTRKNVGITLASASQYNLNKSKIEEWIKNGITTKEILEENLGVLKGTVLEEYTDSFGKEPRQTLNCKCVILTSKYTISAAEDFTAMFKSNKIGTIVGENTYGSTGTPYVLKFDSGLSARICSVYYKLKNDEEFINKGIKPDIYLKNTLKHYKCGTDFVLDSTLDLILNNKL